MNWAAPESAWVATYLVISSKRMSLSNDPYLSRSWLGLALPPENMKHAMAFARAQLRSCVRCNPANFRMIAGVSFSSAKGARFSST